MYIVWDGCTLCMVQEENRNKSKRINRLLSIVWKKDDWHRRMREMPIQQRWRMAGKRYLLRLSRRYMGAREKAER